MISTPYCEIQGHRMDGGRLNLSAQLNTLTYLCKDHCRAWSFLDIKHLPKKTMLEFGLI